ncbi:MAG: methyl-accepting chemotaxis protein [Alphaproteobacteria bacterium]|nr:methyl-accepting chemotaxis protein [Alphaproteobacteria bacterium]
MSKRLKDPMITSDIDVAVRSLMKDTPKDTAVFEEFNYIVSKAHEDISKRIDAVINLSESKTIALSTQFQTLSKNAGLQAEYLSQLISIAQTVKVGSDSVSIQDVSALLHKTFLESINCMLEISKQAMLMVYILNDGTKNLNEIEKSIRQIEIINHKTKYLSINATIEAVRAGEAGESFQVVASEVRDLSNDTQILAINVRSQVNKMSETLNYAQEILQKVASIDMTDNILAKDQLDEMMSGLIDNSEEIAHIVTDASQSSKEFSEATRKLITDIQYQDRVRQDLEAMKKSITAIASLQEVLGTTTLPQPPRAIYAEIPDTITDQIGHLLDNTKEPFSLGMDLTSTQASDDVELF